MIAACVVLLVLFWPLVLPCTWRKTTWIGDYAGRMSPTKRKGSK